MSSEKKALTKSLKALKETKYGKRGAKIAERGLKSLGMTEDDMAKAAALARMIKDKAIEYEIKSGNWRIIPAVDKDEQRFQIQYRIPWPD